jgi:sulfur-carrier protein
MNVQVKLYASLRRYRPASAAGPTYRAFVYEAPAGSTVASLAAALGIPDGLINAAAVNGEAAGVDTTLAEGDEIGLFPPAAGGRQ